MSEPTDNTLPATVATQLVELSVDQVVARVNKMRELQKRVMVSGKHYGVIPGTQKPTLLKAGAELICMTFMLDPQYEHEVKQDGEHREIISRCVLYHIPSGNRIASGEALCTTRESKYAWRQANAACPECGNAETLRRDRKVKGAFYCWGKIGGCGKQFSPSEAAAITGQKVGRMPNPDIADQYNVVLKMANKRALIAAVLNASATSETFTQDLEDMNGLGGDDTGSDDAPSPQEPSAPQFLTLPQQNLLRARARDHLGWEDTQIHELAGVKHLAEIHSATLDGLLAKIEEMGKCPIESNESFELEQERELKGWPEEHMLTFFKRKSVSEFTRRDFNRAMNALKTKKLKS